MTSDRIKEIQETTAYPDSVSVKQALLQVWNECEQEKVEYLKTVEKPNLNIAGVNGSISFEIATKRIRQAVEFGKYKAWNSEVGEQKAQSIMNDFHDGLYGSKNGMWVQVNEAVELMESLCFR